MLNTIKGKYIPLLLIILIIPIAEAEDGCPTGQTYNEYLSRCESATPSQESTLTAAQRCLTDSLLMKPYCTGYNFGAVISVSEWWVIIGTFVGSGIYIFLKTLGEDRNRSIILDSIISGAITIVIVFGFVRLGFNAFIFNFLAKTPTETWLLIGFIVWGIFGAIILDPLISSSEQKKFKNPRVRLQ